MKIEKEDFEQWRDHPVTERVFRALGLLSDQAKQRWIDVSWGGGEPIPALLIELKSKAEVINDLCELTFEELEKWNEE